MIGAGTPFALMLDVIGTVQPFGIKGTCPIELRMGNLGINIKYVEAPPDRTWRVSRPELGEGHVGSRAGCHCMVASELLGIRRTHVTHPGTIG